MKTFQEQLNDANGVTLDTAIAGDFASWGDWYLQFCEERQFDRQQAVAATAPVFGEAALRV